MGLETEFVGPSLREGDVTPDNTEGATGYPHSGHLADPPRSNKTRELRIAKLRHAGGWNFAPGHSPSMQGIPARINARRLALTAFVSCFWHENQAADGKLDNATRPNQRAARTSAFLVAIAA